MEHSLSKVKDEMDVDNVMSVNGLDTKVDLGTIKTDGTHLFFLKNC